MGWSQIPVPHWTLMVFVWSSFIAYVLVTYTILRFRSSTPAFKNAFFTIYLLQVLPDIISMLIAELLTRLGRYNILDVSSFADIQFLVQTTLKTQIVLNHIPIALNRFTVFYKPFLHSWIWSMPFTIFAVACTWAGSGVFTLIYLNTNREILMVHDPETNTWRQEANKASNKLYPILTAVNVSISLCTCLPLYCAAVYFARVRRMTTKLTKLDVKLFICSTIAFVPFVFEFMRCVIYYYSMVTDNTPLYDALQDVWFFTNELMFSTMPWAVLSTNRVVRQKLMAMFCSGRTRKATSTGMNTSST